MESKTQLLSSVSLQEDGIYSAMPLLELTKCIFKNSDRKAQIELHDKRKLFPCGQENKKRLVEHIAFLSQTSLARRWCGYDDTILDYAIDLTIDKFSNIPNSNIKNQHIKHHGPDCRYYFRAFYDYTNEILEKEQHRNVINTEIISARILQKFIERHFHLSCLESKRKFNKLVRRYQWKFEGKTLYIWLPLKIPTCDSRKWLETNISDVNPNRAYEQERVQEIVNKLLARAEIIPIHRIYKKESSFMVNNETLSSNIEEKITVVGLAETVGDEKAENIRYQRPAIRQMGKEQLKKLIQTIFIKLSREDYVEQEIAAQFELSPATFCRFAGNRWNYDIDDGRVPDLWRNTAQTLSGHPTFVAAAKDAGVWKQVSQISSLKTERGKRTHE